MLRGVYLLRHGQSFSNIGYPMIKDSPLTPRGIDQVRKLKYRVDTIICSPMSRTMDTLVHSGLLYNKLYIHNMARELICEPGDCFNWENIYEIEDVNDFNRRMRAFANKIYLLSKKSPSILIITHGCVIKALIDKQIGNCALETISEDRLKDIIKGIKLPVDYHEMTGW